MMMFGDKQTEHFRDSISLRNKHCAIGTTRESLTVFGGELQNVRTGLSDASRDLGKLERGLSSGLRRAFDGVIFDGLKLSDALGVVAKSLVDTAYSSAITPVTQQLGGVLASGVNSAVAALIPNADGAPFSQGRVMPFARGGVISGATTFPMRGGTGLMGEAGPEAIMPLSRGSDGKLGVRMDGGGRPVTVVMNISTPDAQSFQKSRSQIAAQMTRALGRGQRNT